MRALLAAVVVALLALPAGASADEPPFIDWSSWLPPSAGTYQPSAEDDCRSGRPSCVDKVIRSMTQRFDRLAETCDHNAMFSLTYLRTTEEYQRGLADAGLLLRPALRQPRGRGVRAVLLRRVRRLVRRRPLRRPRRWRIAFQAAAAKQVSGVGNMLLGMNAHINRDLPYVLAGIGLVKPDGSSRKPDHDKVNQFLDDVTPTLYPELARRFDPTADDADLPGWLDDMATFQAFPAMREAAWRNAERLVNAQTPLQRRLVEDSIERTAALTAQSIRAATAYAPLSGGSAARDAYCSQHHDDR